MKNLNGNYILHYLKSNLSSKEVTLKFGISKRYATMPIINAKVESKRYLFIKDKPISCGFIKEIKYFK